MADVKLFLSCVSDEFGDYRDALRRALTRPNVEIKIQEDFQNLGGDTLAMLEEYVANCDVVIHFIGDMAGSAPKATSVDDLLRRRPELAARLTEKGMDRDALGRLTYTQWEAWLAIGFNQNGAKKNLVIVTPAYGVNRGAKFAPTDATRASQADHLKWLNAINFYPAKPFTSADNLVARVFGSAVLDALKKADSGSITKPRNLPFASLGGLFAGRDEDLTELHTALLDAKGAPVALYGLGGIGKTRLAIEYAWSREAIYSALLFVSASDGAALNAGMAGLTAFEILDLPEKEARDDATKITAVLRWLEGNPTWLMILDNVDDRAAVAEVAKLMPRLKGGHVIVTARVQFSRRCAKARSFHARRERSGAIPARPHPCGPKQEQRRRDASADAGAGAWQPRARVGAGGRAYHDRSHRLRPLSEALERQPGESARLGGCHGYGFRPDVGHDLGDIGRAALAGEPEAARTARLPRARASSGFAPRHRCFRRGAGH
jgi:hypothetical protein